MERFDVDSAASGATGKRPSPWEWLPPAALPPLILLYCLSAPGGTVNRLALFIGLGLLPGTLWRLRGKCSWNAHRIGFAAGLAAFVLDNPALRPDAETWRKMADGWRLTAAGFLLSFTQPLWGTLRFHRLLIDSGVEISFRETFRLCLSGSFFNLLLPGATGGDAYRVYAVTRGYKTRLAPAVASVTLDRVLGFPALLLVVFGGMALDYGFLRSNRVLSGLIPFIAVAAVICLILVVYLALAGKSSRREQARDGNGAADASGRRPGRLARLHLLIAANVTRPATLPLALFYSFMAHVASIAAVQCFGVVLGVEGLPGIRYYLIVPMAMAINAIPGAPGGIGQGELAMAALLDLAAPGHANAQAGVMIMFLFRISNVLIGLAGGILYAMGKVRRAAPLPPDDAAGGAGRG